MNLERDLQKLRKEKQMKESAIAQLRKRSKDSIARPKAEKNILSTDPRMQQIWHKYVLEENQLPKEN